MKFGPVIPCYNTIRLNYYYFFNFNFSCHDVTNNSENCQNLAEKGENRCFSKIDLRKSNKISDRSPKGFGYSGQTTRTIPPPVEARVNVHKI